MFDEDGRRFWIGNQVIFLEPDCECQEPDCTCHEQKEGDIGVILDITTVPDERDAVDYMHVWLYRNRKVVRAYEWEVLHNHAPDDNFLNEVHHEKYDVDWWQRPPHYEAPPSNISWNDFVDPHTGNVFAKGDVVVIEQNFVFSQFHRHEVDIEVGDKCVLIDFRYEPNDNVGDIQKHYFRLYSYNKKSFIRVMEGSFCHDKTDYRDKIKDIPRGMWCDFMQYFSYPFTHNY